MLIHGLWQKAYAITCDRDRVVADASTLAIGKRGELYIEK
jgi:hypothetical protein